MCGIGLVLTTYLRNSGCLTLSPSLLSDKTRHADITPPSSTFDLELQQRLCQRGPDHYQRVTRHVATESKEHNNTTAGYTIAMHSAVLHLRGDKLTRQPLVDANNNILCWNGEVFGMEGIRDDDEWRLMHGSDTLVMSKLLQTAGAKLVTVPTEENETSDPVVDVIRRVRGPFAVTYLHETSRRLYFAHDRFGRRSLLYKVKGEPTNERHRVDFLAKLAGQCRTSTRVPCNNFKRFVLSNVVIGDGNDDMWQYNELPASGVYVLDLGAYNDINDGDRPSFRIEFYPYIPIVPMQTLTLDTSGYAMDRFGTTFRFPPAAFKAEIPGQGPDDNIESSARALVVALSNAVGVRIRSLPSRSLTDTTSSTAQVAVFFSGGVDSVVLAALSHFHTRAHESIDLLTVCFDEQSGFASPDRRAAELSHAELCELYPERQWNLIKINVSRAELLSQQHEVQMLMAPCDTHMDFNIGAAFWFLSQGYGEVTDVAKSRNPSAVDDLNAFLDPIQANVRTFETKVAVLQLFDTKITSCDTLLCPVYRCGRQRKQECVFGVCNRCCSKIERVVANLCPWGTNRVEVHIDARKAASCRVKLLGMGVQSEDHLNQLLKLVKTYQDAEGLTKFHLLPSFRLCRVHSKHQQHCDASATTATSVLGKTPRASVRITSAPVVLVGIGADEQLAGYERHRTTLRTKGEAALRAALQMDITRLWKRNLGRDDRCIAAHGREARFPYLDEHVVATIATFPVASLCDAQLPRGVGDKRALRHVATGLGLSSCARLAKRAIQFGSRVAKVSSSGSTRHTQGEDKFVRIDNLPPR